MRARQLGLEGKNGLEVMGGTFESAGSRKVGMLLWSHLIRVDWEEPATKEGTSRKPPDPAEACTH